MTERQETKAEEIARLQREIGERQMRLHFLVLGSQSECVTLLATADGEGCD